MNFYDFTKGGTDIVDQIMGKHTVKPKSSKWTIAAFSYILDVACVNASTLSRMNNQNKPMQRSKSFEFDWEIAVSLIHPQLQHRHPHSNGLQKYTQRAIRDLLGKVERRPSRPGKKKHCWACLDKVEGPDHKLCIGVYSVVSLCAQVTSKRSVLAALSERTLEHLQCIYIFAMKKSNMHINDRVFSII